MDKHNTGDTGNHRKDIEMMRNEYILNGTSFRVEGDLTRRLLDVIRDDHSLMGTKESCQEGECGACLVFIDDEIYNSCLVPIGNVIDHSVVTIEDFSKTVDYERIAKAYLDTGAVQCGYCTPGMVMATQALLKQKKRFTLDEIKLELSGNLCRCTGYQTIFEAVEKLMEEVHTDV